MMGIDPMLFRRMEMEKTLAFGIMLIIVINSPIYNFEAVKK